MNDEKYCANWRQVRVFIRDFTLGGFHSFHTATTLQVFPPTSPLPMFVSHYACSDAQDKNDTNIQALPPNFRRPDTCHHSIRIRFRNSCNAEDRLKQAIQTICWYSDFRDFDLVDGLANDRFCDYPTNDLAARRRRARIVTNFLFYSTRFYLDSIRNCGHGIAMETSHCPLNGVLHSPYQSILHMILNPPFMGDRVVGLAPVIQGQTIARL